MTLLSEPVRNRFIDWWHGRNSTPLAMITAWDGSPALPPVRDARTLWLDTESRLERTLYQIEHTVYLGDAFPSVFVNFGPGVLGACMGGNYECDLHTFWFTDPVLDDLDRIDDFRIRQSNFWWKTICELTDALLSRAPENYVVSITDIGGGMDVLAGLRGTEQLLQDLVLEPEKVHRALVVVYEELRKMHEFFARRLLEAQGAMCCWNGIFADDVTFTMQNDFSCMISPGMFREFDMPHLKEIADAIPFAMYHLDGPGAVCHLDDLLDIENLRAIQWVPGSGAPGTGDLGHGIGMVHWIEMLRKIQERGKSVELSLCIGDVGPILANLEGKGLLIKAHCADVRAARRVEEQVMGTRAGEPDRPTY